MSAAAPVCDPTDDAIRRDPFPLFARLQDEDPVHWSPALRTWVVTRYDDVREVAIAGELSPNRLAPFYASLKDEARRSMLAEVMRYLSVWLVFRDPPEHTRLRRILNGVVNPRLVAGMRPQVRRVVDEGRLTEDELVGTCILMLFGGHETTTSLLTNAVNALLDLGRSPNRHLTFGSGIHFCLGAPLARLEAQACLAALLERHPLISRGAGGTEWLDAMVMRGMTRLPLRLS